MRSTLDDKVTALVCATVSGTACGYGGFMVGWTRAQGISLEYDTLLSYGPTLLMAGMFGARGGIEAYSQALEKPALANPVSFAGKVALGSAVTGGFFGGYHQLCFVALGYVAGRIAQ